MSKGCSRKDKPRAVGEPARGELRAEVNEPELRLLAACNRHDLLAIRNNVEAAPSAFRQPQDHVAVALARTTEFAHAIERSTSVTEASPLAPRRSAP